MVEFEKLSSCFKVGKSYLGLDISYNSTGWFYVSGDGDIRTGNITCLPDIYGSLSHAYETNENFEENLRKSLRECIKKDILSLNSKNEVFGGLVVEDVYSGENPQVTRVLYAMNSAIDRMLINKDITIDKNAFKRVQNSEWKVWLGSIAGVVKEGYEDDKEFIEACMNKLDFYEEGKGFQDRLDAGGMLLGYMAYVNGLTGESVKISNVKQNNLMCESIFEYKDAKTLSKGFKICEMVSLGKYTKKTLIEFINSRGVKKSVVYVSEEDLTYGELFSVGVKYPILEGGKLAFWVKGT